MTGILSSCNLNSSSSSSSEYGNDDSDEMVTCPDCDGKGYFLTECTECDGEGGYSTSHTETSDIACGSCGGDGEVTCGACNGAGEIECGNCGGRSGGIWCPLCAGTGSYPAVGYMKTCELCGGDGYDDCNICDNSGYAECDMCDGRGVKQCISCAGSGGPKTSITRYDNVDCSYCGGNGKIKEECANCSGRGTISN